MRTSSRRFGLLLIRWLAATVLPFVSIGSAQTALTDADLSAANLAGKTLTFTIQNGQAPLAASGSYTLALNAAGNSYTLTNVAGATVAATGAYSFSNTGFATLTLTNFVAGLEPLVLSLWTVSGTGRFELNRAVFTNPGFQTGTFTFGAGGGTGAAGGLATASTSATVGANLTLTAPSTGSSYQWQRNGSDLAAATGATLTLPNFSSDLAGIYAASVSGALNFALDRFAVIGVATAAKVIGAGTEAAVNIAHPNGNIYDQLVITGTATTFTADASQITRLSMIDTQNDIIQIEFSGAGTVSVVLEGSSGPAEPVNYVQPGTTYMKGHATIIVSGADETTNLSVFSVGTANAVNQALFRPEVTYDGMADIACIAIHSRNGKFGGLRASNVSFFNPKGLTGVYAPNIQFQGPVFVGDIDASGTATPVLVIGSGSDVRIAGGNLSQTNAAQVQVAGFRALRFTANATSHGAPQAAKANAATFVENGANVTSQITITP